MYKYKQQSYSCRFCSKTFEKGFQLGAHTNTCKLNPKGKAVRRKLMKNLSSKKSALKRNKHVLERKSFAGSKNPNWKGGGPSFKSSAGWKAIRRKIWERDKLCRVCGKPPRKRKFDVHHLMSRRQGGKDIMSNLVGLHHSCHMKLEFGKVKLCP